MTAPVPAHGSAPTDYQDTTDAPAAEHGPGQDAHGEWLTDATVEVAAEQPTRQGPPPGWYVDPADRTVERWWDGEGYPGPSRPNEDVKQPAAAPVDPDTAAAAEREAKARELGAVPVPLDGSNGETGVVWILHPNDWTSWANGRLHIGDFESWAEKCLAPGYYEQVWTRLDPTMRQIAAMFDAYRDATGQSTGKSGLSASSLRRSGRR